MYINHHGNPQDAQHSAIYTAYFSYAPFFRFKTLYTGIKHVISQTIDATKAAAESASSAYVKCGSRMMSPPAQMLSPAWQTVRTFEASMLGRACPSFGSPKSTTALILEAVAALKWPTALWTTKLPWE